MSQTQVLNPGGEFGVGLFPEIDTTITGDFGGNPVNGFTMALGGFLPATWLAARNDCLFVGEPGAATATERIVHPAEEFAVGLFPPIDTTITGDFGGNPVNGFTMIVGGFLPAFIVASGDSCLFVSPELACGNPPPGQMGVFYSHTFPTTGGTPPFVFSSLGTLPLGLTLNASTGVLSGVPTQAGLFVFTIRVTDADGIRVQVQCSILITGCPKNAQGR